MIKTDQSEGQLVTVRELAELLAVPESWIYQRTASGSIPVVRVGRYVRFRVEEVVRWLEGDSDR